jgi:glycerol kinase
MTPTYILAIDQGTTSSRAIVFDKKLMPKGSGQKEFKQYFPNSGWVEHDVEEIWNSVLFTCKAALNKAKLKPQAIASIGYHQPAGNRCGVGPEDGQANPQSYRLARSPHV